MINARHPVEVDATVTDVANAARLAIRADGGARYVWPWNAWRIFEGRIWAPDDCGRLAFYAREVVAELFGDAARASREDQAKLARFAVSSGSRRGIEAMVALAASEADIPIQPGSFDADPFLLNVANGALDLATGHLREHRRNDFCTKLAPVEYVPDGIDPILDRFLADVTGGDAEFAAYLRRAAGYSLTADTSEEVFFILLGPAASGKSTFVESLMAAVGSYATKTSFDTFLERRDVGGARPDIAGLRGVRLTCAVETAQRHRLAEPMLKELTGGDLVTARFLYGQPTTFRPCCKIWLAANDAPKISDTDSGIWRRLRRLPFECVANRPDPAVKKHLTSPAGGRALLAWAVRGCLEWQRDGLGTCSRVTAATAALRHDMDPLAEFLEHRTATGPDLEAPLAALRSAYEAWAAANGSRPISNRDWGARLRALGCERTQGPRPDRSWYWRGIGLLTDRIEL